MLRLHDQEPSYLEISSDDLGFGNDVAPTPDTGTQIGPYKLLKRIGEGGMGTVFMAEQSLPVKRTVAIKIIKPGMDSRRIIARFEAERQALALMDHPNIAKVLDVGSTEAKDEDRRLKDGQGRSSSDSSLIPHLSSFQAGRPYFVMELVQGVPITQYCDEHRLTPQERLELFIPVCQAVQHAHQKGIIHRDLKPSNVMVALYDNKPVPKIIDFGVAKAIGNDLNEHTQLTEFGSVVGTLEYMSPEQAEPGQPDIDTRSDIYSLGALLYELLTGTTPLHPKRLHGAALLELLRIVREEEPPTPSSRLSTTEELPSIAANRHLEPKKLSGLVRGDLDWIVMKCLEKNRTRRYETANGLARDLERYLHDEPVEARSPSASYRLRKFTRRHKTMLTTVMAFVLLLIAGTTVSAWQAVRATAERDAKEEARQAEAAQRRQAVEAKQRADEEAAIAKAVNEFLQQDLLGQADIGNQPAGAARNKNITVRELLDRAADRINAKFKGQERTEAAIRLTMGTAYEGLGDFEKAQLHMERSLELLTQAPGSDQSDALECMNRLGLLYRRRGHYDEATRLFEKVLERRRLLSGDDHRETLAAMHNLAALYREMGRLDDAESMTKRTLEIMQAKLASDDPDLLAAINNYGLLLLSRGRFADAEPHLKRVVKGLGMQQGPDHPLTLTCTNNLASCYMELGRLDDAEPLYRKVLEIRLARFGPDHPDTLFSKNFVALVLNARDRSGEAEPLLREVLAARRARFGKNHPDTLTSASNLALALKKLKRSEEAERLFQEALDGRRATLAADHPDILRSLNNLAVFYRDLGRLEKAEPLFLEAANGAKQKLGLNHPQARLYINNLADLYIQLAKPAEAAKWRQQLPPLRP